MDNKKWILGIIALTAVAALMLGVYFLTRPEPQQGSKTVTVTVVHSDGTEKEFVYHTDEKYLGALLVSEGLIQGANGMYTLVDGEEAVWEENNSWWAFYVGEEMASQGMDTRRIADGDSFKLVYTIG